MKRTSIFWASAIAVALILTAFAAGKASASTGCFTDTNGHWAETFICWMKDEGITSGVGGGLYQPEGLVTRGQMAVFMKAQAEVPPSTGDVYMTFGPNEWIPNYAYDGQARYFTIMGNFTAPTSGTKLFQATPVLPSSLYNTVMYIKGVQICYDARSGGYLDTVTVTHYKTYDDGTTTELNTLTDTTDRTDTMCRQYFFTTPTSFYGDNHLTIMVYYHLNAAGEILRISSTSVVLEPSTSRGTHLTMPEPLAPNRIDSAANPESGR